MGPFLFAFIAWVGKSRGNKFRSFKAVCNIYKLDVLSAMYTACCVSLEPTPTRKNKTLFTCSRLFVMPRIQWVVLHKVLIGVSKKFWDLRSARASLGSHVCEGEDTVALMAYCIRRYTTECGVASGHYGYFHCH